VDQSGTRRYAVAAAQEDGVLNREEPRVEETSPVRQFIAPPAREITLDKTRVEQALVTIFDDNQRIAQQYERLAVALCVGAERRPLKRVLVSSAHAGDGRTSVVLNLASALAQTNRRVLVVDCDLRGPSVLRSLGVEAEVGLVEILTDDLPFMNALVRVNPTGIDILPTRERVDRPMTLLSSPSFLEIITTLDHLYDFILFDSPPLMDASSQLLVHLTDAALLVIRSGRTNSAQLAIAIEPLTEDSLVGVVLNRVP
jgi:capsular exopolysaccharide synthesis family protein